MLIRREAGVLLHITSLPGTEGIGTLGDDARTFGRWLKDNGFSVWQMLPLCHAGYAQSPYLGLSAFAGNPMLIDLRYCEKEYHVNLDIKPVKSGRVINFEKECEQKMNYLRSWYRKVCHALENDSRYIEFCSSESFWLDDYALFAAFRATTGSICMEELPLAFRIREKSAIEALKKSLNESVVFYKMLQYEFFRQWDGLRAYLAEMGVKVMGDIPIYVAYDSCDVWRYPELFSVDGELRLTSVAGVPPDYFSKTGQLWGNPVYNWEMHKETDYYWWRKRMGKMMGMYDMIRIDHFRGFDTYWDIPAGSDTAEGGQWKPGPGRDLFQVLLNNDNRNKIIAEDLGDYSETVEKLRDDLSFPGMRVMQFAFGEGKGNPHNPHLHTANSVVYTGTHDNDTLAGWLKGLQKEEKSLIASYLGCRESELFHSVIRAAVSSVARLCVLPMQDMLKMGSESRMNIPGTTEGNWKWRMPGDYAESVTVKTVSEMIKIYERLL